MLFDSDCALRRAALSWLSDVSSRWHSDSKQLDQQKPCSTTSPSWRLLEDHEVPETCRQPGIRGGYVPTGSLRVCVASMFSRSNETVNFWSHVLAVLYFTWRTCQLCESVDVRRQPVVWPYLSYMLTVCVYPLASCLAHAFSAVSPRADHLLFFLDYAAVSLFSFGAGLLARAYCFPLSWQHGVYEHIFMSGSLLMSAVSTALACRSRFLSVDSTQKRMKVAAYLLPYMWNNVPVMVRALLEPSVTSSGHLSQLLLSVVSGVAYGSGLPERAAPGWFDVFGHSHNLLHFAGTAATYQQMNAAHVDMMHVLQASTHNPRWLQHVMFWASSGLLACVCVNAVIVTAACVTVEKKSRKSGSSVKQH